MESLNQTVGELRRVSREVVRELGFLQHRIGFAGITHSQCHALLELERHGTLTVLELSKELRLDKSTTSRVVAGLLERGLATTQEATDRRVKPLVLTAAGRERIAKIHRHANQQVEGALAQLSDSDRQMVVRGMALYANALAKSKARKSLSLRPIRPADDVSVARIIRQVMTEFGLNRPGTAIHDPELGRMSQAFRGGRSAYFVVVQGERVVGGGGVAPLPGGDAETCEIQKMYFLPEVRGLGMGNDLFEQCLRIAKQMGYRRCYLETVTGMTRAIALYEGHGFHRLKEPLGNTGHYACNAMFVKEL